MRSLCSCAPIKAGICFKSICFIYLFYFQFKVNYFTNMELAIVFGVIHLKIFTNVLIIAKHFLIAIKYYFLPFLSFFVHSNRIILCSVLFSENSNLIRNSWMVFFSPIGIQCKDFNSKIRQIFVVHIKTTCCRQFSHIHVSHIARLMLAAPRVGRFSNS